jgi:23S rRNA pseudouridine1911/1915/1917 synthase
VLYEDDQVVVLDKPAGLPSVPIPGSATPSALSLLSVRLKTIGQRAFVVHRIDRFTSGVLLFAKSQKDREVLIGQFLAHSPVRQYLAVVRGRVAEKKGTLIHYFQREGMWQQLRSQSDTHATRAELHYAVERLFAEASLIRVELVTGLQNQIRAQFAAIGHPVIGDRKYHVTESAEPLIARVALHAAHLAFAHPRSGATISVDGKLPSDFRHLVQELSRATRARR